MSLKNLLNSTGLAAFAALPLVLAQPLQAQERSAQPSGGLEEIVVTARKREENLVDVPLSISAFSEAFIEKTGMDNVVDLANQTPGLSFRPAFGRVGSGEGGGSSNRPTLRGQANIVGVPNLGFFVDGVYVSGNVTSYQLDNVQRIEVIRGPQSALFGRGTFAGAVNFVTRKPGDELAGKLEATLGQHDRFEVSGYFNGPLIGETLKGEVNFRSYKVGGEWLNRATGEKDGGGESTRNLGAKLYWTPTDGFDLEFNVGYSHDVDDTFASRYSGTNCLLPNITSINAMGQPVSSNRRRGYFCGETSVQDTFFARWDILEGLGLDGVNRETFRSSLKANLELGEWTLTGIAAANRFRNLNAFDSTYEQAEFDLRPFGLSANQDRRKDWSAELRIDSPRDRRVHGLAGVYYYKQNDGRGFRGSFTPSPALTTVPIGANLISLVRNLTQDDSFVNNRSVFGLLEFNVTERLKLTAEARYQIDTITSDQFTELSTNALLQNDFKKFLPRATALFNINDRWNLFANLAKGNKPGGFNRIPTDGLPAERPALVDDYQTFEEESAKTYEIGIKGGNENRTFSLTTALYQIDWTSQQLTRTYLYTRASDNTLTSTTALINAGETRIRGLEVDLNFKPTESVDLRLAYALVDSEVLDFVDTETEDIYDTDGRVGSFNLAAGDTNGQVAGAQVPQSPKHQIILSGGYTQPINDSWKGFIRSDATYESKRFDQVHNLAHTGASTLVNLRTGLESDSWTVTLYCTNLLDDDTPASLTRLVNGKRPLILPSRPNPALQQSTTFRDVLIAYPHKRAVGLTATYKF